MKTSSKTDYTVMDYNTASPLDGIPSADLVEASLRTAEGAALAYVDADGVWQYVPDSQQSLVELRGETVRTVYVQE